MVLAGDYLREFKKYMDYVFIVEGKKDVSALRSLGFDRVYEINGKGLSLKESVERISFFAGKNRICILTDFDKKGKELYFKIKSILSEMRGVKIDSSFRSVLRKAGVSHVESVDKFLEEI